MKPCCRLTWLPAVMISAVVALTLQGCAIFNSNSIAHQQDDSRTQKSYWISSFSLFEKEVLNREGIRKLNENLIKNKESGLYDLRHYPLNQKSTEISKYIQTTYKEFENLDLEKTYNKDRLLTRKELNEAIANCNTEKMPKFLSAKFAVTLNRTNLRALPVQEGWYESPMDINYDLLQITALDPSEPVLILRESLDKDFYYVQSRYARGWVATNEVAFTDHKTFFEYVSPSNFLIVTAPQKVLFNEGRRLVYQMGARIPLFSSAKKENSGDYTVKLPSRSHNHLIEVQRPVKADDSVHCGYLEYTRANILKQALRFNGNVYGYHGQNESVDSASFVQDVYKTVGILLPRTPSAIMLSLPKVKELDNALDKEVRQREIQKLSPSTLLLMRGHVMLYLGTDMKGEPTVIHAVSSYSPSGSNGAKNYIRRVIISDMSLKNQRDMSLMDRIHAIADIN